MARKLLSFLGTTNYTEITYVLKEKDSKRQRFVQASLAELICKDWSEEDSIHIFLTKEAEEKNWESSINPGLKQVLEKLELPFRNEHIIPVKNVPRGSNEDEIWDIFNKIIEQIKDGDEIYFDITHAFRHLPMLAIIALNYVRVVYKNIKIGGIYYGAYEAKENDKAPVLDLIGFENLMRWTAGVDRFVGTGDASILNGLVKEKKLSEDSPEKKLVENMEEFGKIMATCRGRKIGEGAKAVKDSIEGLKVSLKKERKPGLSPLVHLLDKIEDKMKGFGDDDIKDGLEAVKWCIEHNMTQQGYTILEEIIITWLAKEYYKDEPCKIYETAKRLIIPKILYLLVWYEIDDKVIEKLGSILDNKKVKKIKKFKNQRSNKNNLYTNLQKDGFNDDEIEKIITYAYVFDNDVTKEKWDKSLKDEKNIKKVEEIKNIKNIISLAEYFSELASDYRNDLGHAGCRDKPMEPLQLIAELQNYFEKIRNFLNKD